jgi:hypothetical protein
VCQPDTTGADWSLAGNAGTDPTSNFIGTTDNQPFELRVNNVRVARIEPPAAAPAYDRGPNVVLGDGGNSVGAGVQGAFVAGGGVGRPNQVTGNFAVVAGGSGNTTALYATVGGGQSNTAGGYATVAGGVFNTASGDGTAVGGGRNNAASDQTSTVAGGANNIASGFGAAVPGGLSNEAGGFVSLAAGRRAKVRNPTQSGSVEGDTGTFVWSDTSGSDFISTGPNQFLIRAVGGVAINTARPATGAALTVSGNLSTSGNTSTSGAATFGAQTRQMVNLYGTGYGIGVQGYAQYFRNDVGAGFAWFSGGVHSDTQYDPGAGGTRQMKLDSLGNLFVRGTVNPNGADFAEMLPGERGLEPGDVVAIGADGSLVKSTQPYQLSVAGVFSTQPGIVGGAADGADTSGKVPLAVVGIVPVKVSAEGGPIRPGDRLVASATPGHAMRCATDVPVGSVIGKALSPLESGTGTVRMLVVLQ